MKFASSASILIIAPVLTCKLMVDFSLLIVSEEKTKIIAIVANLLATVTNFFWNFTILGCL